MRILWSCPPLYLLAFKFCLGLGHARVPGTPGSRVSRVDGTWGLVAEHCGKPIEDLTNAAGMGPGRQLGAVVVFDVAQGTWRPHSRGIKQRAPVIVLSRPIEKCPESPLEAVEFRPLPY
jgi:hypothetical protein